jgi:hypothetical protein
MTLKQLLVFCTTVSRMFRSILEFSIVFVFFVLTHNVSVYFYSRFCANLSFFGMLSSFFMIPTPQCRALLTVINYTSDSYVAGFYAVSTIVFKYLCNRFQPFKIFTDKTTEMSK